jgi:Virulence-associated protein E
MNKPSDVRSNTDETVSFHLLRGKRAVLSCQWIEEITGATGKFETESFELPADVEKLRKWTDTRQGRANQYYTVNQTTGPMHKKPERKDMKSLSSLHVDVDPRAGQDLDAERVRILKLLQDYPLPPTYIIDSGAGYQAVWDLKEEVPINGNLEIAEELKLYNITLERQLQGDKCHNIDRLMRSPGTINCPDERKRKKGRQYASASIVSQRQTQYTLADFIKAPPLRTDNAAAPASAAVDRAVQQSPQASSTVIIKRSAIVIGPVADFKQRVSPTGQLIRELGADRNKLCLAMKEAGLRDDPYCSNSEMGLAYVHTLINAQYSNEEIAGDVLDKSNPAGIHFRQQKDKVRSVRRAIDAVLLSKQINRIESKSGVHFPDGYTFEFKPKSGYGNTRAAFDALGIQCSCDVFREKTFVESHAIEEVAGDFADLTVTVIQDIIYDRFEFYPNDNLLRNAISRRASQNSFDPVLDAVNSLVWDGTPRLDNLLPTYLGAATSPFVRAVGRKAFIGLVRRVREPGCKNDSMLILEGPQGVGKSLFCRDLAGEDDLFSDADILALDGKAQQELLTGKLVCEIPELAGLRKAEVEKTKALITRTSDLARPAYGRLPVNRPRRCIFIGTTNEEKYLRDHSGNRRFWPVRVSKYDRETFLRDRDQLLAEAAHYEALSESLYLPAEISADAVSEQTSRMVQDGWADLLASVKGVNIKGEEWIASTFLLKAVLDMQPEKHDGETFKRLGRAMRELGWQGPVRHRINGPLVQGYHRPATSAAMNVPF